MSRFTRWAASVALALSAVLVAAPAARAEVSADSGNVEVFVGWLWPEDVDGPDVDDDWTYGIRGGYNFTKHFGLEVGVQGFNSDIDMPAPFNDFDADGIFADLTFVWMVNPDDRAVFQVFGGPGFGWWSYDDNVSATKDDDDDTWTAHFGVGGKISCTKRFYLRPEARVRWFDDDEDPSGADGDGHTDLETSIGFGWYLGQ